MKSIAHYIALYAGTPVKLHTNLCGKWFAMTDEIHATKFKCEQTAVSQCALHGVPSVTIVPIDLVADYAANKPTDADISRVVTLSLTPPDVKQDGEATHTIRLNEPGELAGESVRSLPSLTKEGVGV